MILEHILEQFRSVLRRSKNRRLRRRSRCDLSRLSDHTLRDIGYYRDGDWVGPDADL